MNEIQKPDFINQALIFLNENGFDSSNNLGDIALRYLEYYCTMHFKDNNVLHTLETGCGASTFVFSNYATSHIVHDMSVDFQKKIDLLNKFDVIKQDNIVFRHKHPADNTMKRNNKKQYDIILINGISSYPIPDVDFYFNTPSLKNNGILIINNIHVPTINKIYEFIKEDEMFYLHKVVQNAAFFVRTGTGDFDYKAKNWKFQSFNSEKFTGTTWNKYGIGLPMPMNYQFDGRLKELGPWFDRGFCLFKGRPISDGWFSDLKLQFQNPVVGPVTVTLDLEVIAPEDRTGAGVSIDINQKRAADIEFKGTKRQEVVLTAEIDGSNELQISLTHQDVRFAEGLRGADEEQMYFCRRPNIVLHELSVRPRGIDKIEHCVNLRRADGSIMSFDYKGQNFRFFVEDHHDSIQAHHNAGEFYEIEELELLTRFIPRNARILDIGANIGNHSVWFEKILGAQTIVPVEPQTRMVALYKTNCQLNGLITIDERCLGLALGDANQFGEVQIDQAFNPAGARIAPSATGDIQIRVGDEILADDVFDFVKIDVEGAELNVVRGLKQLVARCRPMLFVEVWEENRAEFDQLMIELDYEVVGEYRRYDIATNLLLRARVGSAI